MRTQFSKLALAVAFGLALAFTYSCSDDNDSCSISGYKTKQIGTQNWMAENLNCNVSGSRCYKDDPANCDKYGRLYNWSTAMSVCPRGWHLPSMEDWNALVTAVGGASTAGGKLKATSGWNSGNGTDDYDFSALPGGTGNSDGSFSSIGSSGFWWSSSESISGLAGYKSMDYSDKVEGYNSYSKDRLFSVRCLKD